MQTAVVCSGNNQEVDAYDGNAGGDGGGGSGGGVDGRSNISVASVGETPSVC